jgi:MFS transporter, DHA2 family, multidrug resistance protein
VKQQAFTLAITDSFLLVAWSIVCCLIVIAGMAPVPIQYRHVMQVTDAPA